MERPRRPAAGPLPPVADGPSPVMLLVQMAFMFFMYQQYMGRKTPVVVTTTASPVGPGVVAPAPALDLGGMSVPAPGAAAVPELPSWAPQEMKDMMRIAAESASGKRTVPAALRVWEDERVARAAAAGNGKIVPLWPAGVTYEARVYLSERPSPLTMWASEYDARDWGAEVGVGSQVQGEAVAGAGVRGTVSAQWSLMGDVVRGWTSRLSRSIGATNPPPLVLRNDSFTGLLRVDTGAQGAEHAPPLAWKLTGLAFEHGRVPNFLEQRVQVSLPPSVRANASTLYAHIVLATGGASPDPSSPQYDSTRVITWVHPLMKYLPKKPEKVTFNLLEGDGENGHAKKVDAAWGIGRKSVDEEAKVVAAAVSASGDLTAPAPPVPGAGPTPLPVLPFWKPSLALEPITDGTTYGGRAGPMPPNVKSAIQVQPIVPHKAGDPAFGYVPLFAVNDFWTLGSHLVAVNESVMSVPLVFAHGPAPMWRWAIQTQMAASWDVQATMGTGGSSETDMIKSIIIDTNPVLLAVTGLVSMLHMIFDFLAFKNDVSFWRSAKSLEGLSVRTLTLNLVQQLIIAAYLFNENTSYMILFSVVIGVGIEVWKLRKAISVNLSWGTWRGLPIPRVDFSDKEESYSASRTKEYDDYATAHLLFILYPLIVGYSAYSLLYERHKSWTSWILGSLVGFVYTFGFIQMVPQLYINYRLKSVAHLPWRAMVYKSLNTFIDDLFAFVVKMPTLHRISVFRDDIIFFCYLYQRWIYRVDPRRKNEFGASAEDYDAIEARKLGVVRQPRRGKLERRA